MIRRRPRLGDDRGTSLTIALVLITVFALVIAIVLTFADTSLRTTLVLREQASDAAGADGAGEIAVNALRSGSYVGTGTCFGSGASATNTLVLRNVYQPATGPADSAAVTCEPDPGTSAYSPVTISDATKPRNAILTLGTNLREEGLTVDVEGGGNVRVHGGVFSQSSVVVPRGSLTTDASLKGRRGCTGTITGSPVSCPYGSTVDPAGDDPNYAAPNTVPGLQLPPICLADNSLITFEPGLYTDIATLNLLSACRNSTYWFKPGTYFFSFPGLLPWTIENGYVVAGTPTTPLVAGTPPTMPGSCRSPVPPVPASPSWTAPPADGGVQFVFAGASRMMLRSTRAEICGTYSDSKPPIAVYGLKSAIGLIPAQNGCTVVAPYPLSLLSCPTFATEGAGGQLYVQGTVYLPQSVVDIAPGNPNGPVFAVGVVARAVRIAPLPGSGLGTPLVTLPENVDIGRRTMVLLTVYLCPGEDDCSTATGTIRLRAKVGIVDPTGVVVPGTRRLTVYSWSAQRA